MESCRVHHVREEVGRLVEARGTMPDRGLPACTPRRSAPQCQLALTPWDALPTAAHCLPPATPICQFGTMARNRKGRIRH